MKATGLGTQAQGQSAPCLQLPLKQWHTDCGLSLMWNDTYQVKPLSPPIVRPEMHTSVFNQQPGSSEKLSYQFPPCPLTDPRSSVNLKQDNRKERHTWVLHWQTVESNKESNQRGKAITGGNNNANDSWMTVTHRGRQKEKKEEKGDQIRMEWHLLDTEKKKSKSREEFLKTRVKIPISR